MHRGYHLRPKAKSCITNASLQACSNYLYPITMETMAYKEFDLAKHGFHGNGMHDLTAWLMPIVHGLDRCTRKRSKALSLQ